MKHKDKWMHAGIGFAVQAAFMAVGLMELGLLVVTVAAWLKEEHDRHDPLNHTFDGWDMAATLVGAVVAQQIGWFWKLWIAALGV